MESRLLTLAHEALSLPIQRILHPGRDLGVLGATARHIHARAAILVLVVLGDGVRLRKRCEPAVLQEHGVGGAQLGDLVQAAADEVAGEWGVAFCGEIGGVAVDDRLWLESIWAFLESRDRGTYA